MTATKLAGFVATLFAALLVALLPQAAHATPDTPGYDDHPDTITAETTNSEPSECTGTAEIKVSHLVPGETVTITVRGPRQYNRTLSAVADPNGDATFSLSGLCPGNYRVRSQTSSGDNPSTSFTITASAVAGPGGGNGGGNGGDGNGGGNDNDGAQGGPGNGGVQVSPPGSGSTGVLPAAGSPSGMALYGGLGALVLAAGTLLLLRRRAH